MTEFTLPNNTGYKKLPEGVKPEDISVGTIVLVAFTDVKPYPVFVTQNSHEDDNYIYYRGFGNDFEEFSFESDQIVKVLYHNSYLVDLMDNANI